MRSFVNKLIPFAAALVLVLLASVACGAPADTTVTPETTATTATATTVTTVATTTAATTAATTTATTTAATTTAVTTTATTTAKPSTHEHVWGEWSKGEGDKCTSRGTSERTCTACGATESATGSWGPHSWKDDGTCKICACRPISTAEELKNLPMDGSFVLVNDIDLGGAEWTPLGTRESPFKAYLWGADHVISNFKITEPAVNENYEAYAGFIGYGEYFTLLRVHLEDFTVDRDFSADTSYAGALVACSVGGKVNNCSASNGSVSIRHAGGSLSCVGGLVGSIDAPVRNSRASVDVSAESTSAPIAVGGLVGLAKSNVESSYASGRASAEAVEADGLLAAGGLVGQFTGGYYSSSIVSCFATGDVSLSADSCGTLAAGGLVGSVGTAYVKTSFATGDVSAKTGSGEYKVSGLVGASSGKIEQCYRSKDQSLTREIGGRPSTVTDDSAIAVDPKLFRTVAFYRGPYVGVWSELTWSFVEGELPRIR